MDVMVFNQPTGVRHGRFHFIEGVPYGFEDPDAAPYFKALAWAVGLIAGYFVRIRRRAEQHFARSHINHAAGSVAHPDRKFAVHGCN